MDTNIDTSVAANQFVIHSPTDQTIQWARTDVGGVTSEDARPVTNTEVGQPRRVFDQAEGSGELRSLR
jgi:hypothetical protein